MALTAKSLSLCKVSHSVSLLEQLWMQLMELLPFFLAKGQHQQGTCSNMTGSLADPLHPSGYDGRLEAAAPACVGQSSIHQGSDHVCPDLRGPLLELRVGIW